MTSHAVNLTVLIPDRPGALSQPNDGGVSMYGARKGEGYAVRSMQVHAVFKKQRKESAQSIHRLF